MHIHMGDLVLYLIQKTFVKFAQNLMLAFKRVLLLSVTNSPLKKKKINGKNNKNFNKTSATHANLAHNIACTDCQCQTKNGSTYGRAIIILLISKHQFVTN